MMAFASGVLGACLPLYGQIPVTDSADFSKDKQIAAITATVQIKNPEKNLIGSGVVIGRSEPFDVYVLTAHHVVQGSKRLEVAVFSKDSYPKPKSTFDRVTIVADEPGPADLALLRVSTSEAVPSVLKVCPADMVPATFTGLAVGCSFGRPPTTWTKKVPEKKLTLRKGRQDMSLSWEVDELPVQGRSGGPIIDGRSYVLGICSIANDQKCYFTHVDEIHRFLKSNGFRWLIEDKEDKDAKKTK
jgi:S1-C subfamily serine protease